MDKIAKAIGGAVLLAVALFFVILLGTAIGAVVGWTVGLVFGATILAVLSKVGITGIAMWQFGAFLGFVSGFFRQNSIKAPK